MTVFSICVQRQNFYSLDCCVNLTGFAAGCTETSTDLYGSTYSCRKDCPRLLQLQVGYGRSLLSLQSELTFLSLANEKKFFCRSNYLVSHPRAAGVSMTSVSFPSPHPSSFSVPPRTKHGYPQVKLRISQKFGLQNDSSINLYTCILVINKLKEMKVREDIIV